MTPFFPGVMERVRRYDPRLFLRWNRTRGQYELWRFRPEFPIPSKPTLDDIRKKANPQIEVAPDQFDHRVFRRLWLGDIAHQSPNLTAEEVNKQLARQDKAKDEAAEKDLNTMVDDIVADNKKQIRRDFFDNFAGYYG